MKTLLWAGKESKITALPDGYKKVSFNTMWGINTFTCKLSVEEIIEQYELN